ncbi:MAG: polysaccharide biosynthesis/export family protein [Planctomycetota bacterium]
MLSRFIAPLRPVLTKWVATLSILGCLFCFTGCSMLGFAPVPVAHLMLEDTKAVLEGTPAQSRVPRELSKQVPVLSTLQPGDQVFLEMVGSDIEVRLPPDQEVMADGSLDLGEFGRVVVAGLTLEQAEDLIQRALLENEVQEPRVNVRLLHGIQKFYVIGEVNSPGAYPLTGHETVLDAIMEAGGLTARASGCDLLLARPSTPCSCRVTLPVCYRAITQLGDTTTNYHLHAGDRIFVARQSFKEELLAYVSGAKTCERCCAAHAACRDAESVGAAGPRFFSGGQYIAAPRPPERKDDNELELDDDPIEIGPGGRSLENQPMVVPSPVKSSRREPDSKRLDGELDFSEFESRLSPQQ